MGSFGAIGCTAPSTNARPSREPREWRLAGPFRLLSDSPDDRSAMSLAAFAPKDMKASDDARKTSNWHFDFGLRVGHTRLGSTKQQLDRRLDLPMKLDIFGIFDSPETPMDRKSELGLNTIYLGAGFQQSDWMIWNFYLGGGAGKDSDHQRVANLNLSVDFHYAHIYTGVQCEMYPWGLPDYLNNLDWYQRLQASRPYIMTGFESGFVDAGGRGDFSVAPFKIYEDEVTVRDWLFSYLLGAGWAIPINDRMSVNLSTHYSFHFYRPEEYNTWNFVSTLRFRF